MQIIYFITIYTTTEWDKEGDAIAPVEHVIRAYVLHLTLQLIFYVPHSKITDQRLAVIQINETLYSNKVFLLVHEPTQLKTLVQHWQGYI